MKKEFSANDCRVSFLGREVAVKKINYEVSQEKNTHYKLGSNDPHTTVKQRKECSGSIEIYQTEYNALVNSLSSNYDVLDIEPFRLIIIYEASGKIASRELKNVEFTSYGEEVDSEADLVTIELPFVFTNIDTNIA